MAHPQHDRYLRHVGSTIGRGPLARFDPDLDFYARYPFNAGVFASRRLAIKEADLASLHQAERAFYRDVLDLEAWTWQSKALFFRDQGRLNYLVAKLSIPVLPLAPELICRAGASAIQVSVAEVERGACDFHIVHWMGAKSPSPSLVLQRALVPDLCPAVVVRRQKEGLLDRCPATSGCRSVSATPCGGTITSGHPDQCPCAPGCLGRGRISRKRAASASAA